MLFILPVNWDRVISSLAKALPASDIKFGNPPCIRQLNFGPGTGLMRSMDKSCKLSDGISVDLTFDAARVGERKSKQEPIMIVGMAGSKHAWCSQYNQTVRGIGERYQYVLRGT